MAQKPRLKVLEGGVGEKTSAPHLRGCEPLMAQALAGDRAAYDQLLRRCDAWLRMYLAKRIAPQLIDDIAQEVLLALHKKRHTYDPRQPFAPWFVAIVRYKWLDRLRHVYKERDLEILEDDAGATGSHERAVLSSVLLERLLALLPAAQAAVIRLVKIDGLSVEEAALTSGQSASLVKVNIHRGRKAILRHLEASHE